MARDNSTLVDSEVGRNPIVRFGRSVRRGWRRVRRRWGVAQVRFIFSDAYSGTAHGIPLDPMRGWKILGFLVDEGLLDRDDISVPRPPALRSLLRWRVPRADQRPGTGQHRQRAATPLTRPRLGSLFDHESERQLDRFGRRFGHGFCQYSDQRYG